MLRNSFQRKLALFFTALVAAVQIGALVAVVFATNQNVRRQVEQELAVGARVVERLLDSRSRQLLQSVQVLTADFGFKQAVATGDRATIRSVLGNHGARIEADMAVLLDPDGLVRASTLGDLRPGAPFPVEQLREKAVTAGESVGFGLIGERAYQLVIVPVQAPQVIAWACLGFRIDDGLAAELARLTGTDVSFEAHVGQSGRVLATSLPQVADVAMTTGHDSDPVRRVETGGESRLVTARRLAARDDYRLDAVLQVSMASALAPYEPLKERLIALAVAALAITLVGATWLARTVSRPVRQLLGAAERIAAGDYAEPVGVNRGDELGSLAAAFERMQSAIREREARIVHQAYHDELTGLPNRTLVRDRLRQEIQHAARDGHCVAVVVLDLNRFKEINDSLGHDMGDRVLATVAERLSGALRASDTVARLGGDEFCVVAPCSGKEEANSLCERIGHAWEEALELGSTTLRIDRSLGMALYPDHGDEVEALLRRADIAMYAAKAHNLAAVHYESGWDEHHQRQLTLVADLRKAIEGDQLTLEYQPQIDLATGTVSHAEALLRWDHPDLGRISPGEFIPLAENAGYVRSLTRWVVGEVVRQCGAWVADGTDLHVSVNISALDLLDDSLPPYVSRMLEHHAVPPERIALEITESAVMQDAACAMRVLQALRDTGVRLSIDDFGTGESSLAQLRRLPVDELKIDKSFILDLREADADDSVEAIVRSTIELGHNMGLSVVAEGVESTFSREWLLRYRCDLAQGYLFSRPLAPRALEEWIERFRKEAT